LINITHPEHIRQRIMALLKPLILFFNPVRHAKAYYEGLQKIARTEVVTSKSREEFFKDIKDKYNSVSVIYRTSASGAVRRIPTLPLARSANMTS
jgi:hypothetical protein